MNYGEVGEAQQKLKDITWFMRLPPIQAQRRLVV